MKKITATFLFLFIGFTIQAQDYNTALGLRIGASNGITVRHHLQPARAIEGILTTRWHGFNITGLYEFQYDDAFKVDHLNWYFGGGANIGIANEEYYYNDNSKTGSELLLGVDGIIGMEYNFNEVPLNLSLDWKPVVNLSGAGFIGDEFALSIRYLFK